MSAVSKRRKAAITIVDLTYKVIDTNKSLTEYEAMHLNLLASIVALLATDPKED